MKPLLLALAALALVTGCGKKNLESVTPEIKSEIKEGVSPLVFAMRDYRSDPSGKQSFTIVGTHEGRPVGLDLEFDPWNENPPGFVNMTTWSCTVRARSRGDATEEFVRALDAVYGTRMAPKQFAPVVELQALSLWAKPGNNFEGDPVRLVLLFPGDIMEDQHPEVFFAVDREKSRVEWKEKDPRHRKGLVRAFGAGE
jgi:hypothetical protein